MRFFFHSYYQKDVTTSPMWSSRFVPLCFLCLPVCCPLYQENRLYPHGPLYWTTLTSYWWFWSYQPSASIQRQRGFYSNKLHHSPKMNFHFQNSCFGTTLDGTAKDWSEPAALTVWTTQRRWFCLSEAAHLLFWGKKDYLHSAALGEKTLQKNQTARSQQKQLLLIGMSKDVSPSIWIKNCSLTIQPGASVYGFSKCTHKWVHRVWYWTLCNKICHDEEGTYLS